MDNHYSHQTNLWWVCYLLLLRHASHWPMDMGTPSKDSIVPMYISHELDRCCCQMGGYICQCESNYLHVVWNFSHLRELMDHTLLLPPRWFLSVPGLHGTLSKKTGDMVHFQTRCMDDLNFGPAQNSGPGLCGWNCCPLVACRMQEAKKWPKRHCMGIAFLQSAVSAWAAMT